MRDSLTRLADNVTGWSIDFPLYILPPWRRVEGEWVRVKWQDKERENQNHRLNMEVDFQSLFGLHVTWCAHCTAVLIGWDPATPPPPPALDSYYEGAIGQQRQTTPLCNPLIKTFTVNPTDKKNQVVETWDGILELPFKSRFPGIKI